MRSKYLVGIVPPQKPLVQFEFKLELHKIFLRIRFCSRFLATVKVAQWLEIGKIESFKGTLMQI